MQKVRVTLPVHFWPGNSESSSIKFESETVPNHSRHESEIQVRTVRTSFPNETILPTPWPTSVIDTAYDMHYIHDISEVLMMENASRKMNASCYCLQRRKQFYLGKKFSLEPV